MALNLPWTREPTAFHLSASWRHSVIIDRHTFIDLATHLEGASEGVLDITRRCVALCEDATDGAPEGQT